VGATAANPWTPLATTRIATSLRPQVEQAVSAGARMISCPREITYELPQAVTDPVDNSVAARYRGSCGSGPTKGRWPTPGHPTSCSSWAREP
jgi:hypothetical protein